MGSFTIAGRELRSLFLSPLAWTILAVTQVICAYIFLIQIVFFKGMEAKLAAIPGAPGLTEIVVNPLLRSSGIVMLLLAPLLTMRSFSEERRSGSIILLLSAPISVIEIVMGKYLGLLGFLFLAVLMISVMPLSLSVGTSLDFGLFAAGVLGLLLLVSAFVAAGLFFSSLTENPTVSAVSTFGLLLCLWILDWAGSSGGGPTGDLLNNLALLPRYDALLKGEFDTADIAYYLLFITLFLGLAVYRLDLLRMRHR